MADQQPNKYRYDALSNRTSSIRLLSVQGVSSNKLICSLRVVPTLDREHYHCLSYTWGDPFGRTDVQPSQEQMICNGTVVPIQRNLHDGLVHLYTIATQRGKLGAIWVDAICINQNDDAEKADQIKMMHKIYAGAASVVIWLGPDDSGDDDGSGGDGAKIKVIADAMREQFGEEKLAKSASWDKFLTDLHDSAAVERADLPIVKAIGMDVWRAVSNISAREYWQRLWVWQEVMAAKCDPIVLCGRSLIEWEDLRLASHGQIMLGKSTLGGKLRPGMTTRNRPHQMAWWRDQYLERGPDWMRQKFGRLVLMVNRNLYVCWDERDKIFAHVGICQRTELARWDYSKPFEELYVHFWCEIMQRVKEVNFLTLVEDASARKSRPRSSCDGSRAVELPSWVPDLRCCLDPPSLWDSYQFNPEFNVSKGLEATFPEGKKHADSINGLNVDEPQRQLRMWGYRFDVVAGCGETSTEAQEQKAIPCIVALLRDIARTIETSPYGSQSGADDAISASLAVAADDTGGNPSFPVSPELKDRAAKWLFHNLACGRISGHDNAYTREQDLLMRQFPNDQVEKLQSLLDKYAEDHRAYLGSVTSQFLSESSAGSNTENSYEPFSIPASTFSQQTRDGSIGMAAMVVGDWGLRRRRLFRTDEGWVGKGPESMMPGDEVWIVPGGEVPFILRPKGDGMFRYVGHGYVHGIMGGEAVDRFSEVKMTEVILE